MIEGKYSSDYNDWEGEKYVIWVGDSNGPLPGNTVWIDYNRDKKAIFETEAEMKATNLVGVQPMMANVSWCYRTWNNTKPSA